MYACFKKPKYVILIQNQSAIQGGKEFEWSSKGYHNRSGRLIITWNMGIFNLTSVLHARVLLESMQGRGNYLFFWLICIHLDVYTIKQNHGLNYMNSRINSQKVSGALVETLVLLGRRMRGNVDDLILIIQKWQILDNLQIKWNQYMCLQLEESSLCTNWMVFHEYD